MAYLPNVWDDNELIEFLVERCLPCEANPTECSVNMGSWKALVSSFTRQGHEAIFTARSLAQELTRLPSLQPARLVPVLAALSEDGVIARLRREGVIEWLANLLFNTAEDTEFVNVEAADETCRLMRLAIKAQHFDRHRVAYADVWNVCQYVCNGSETLFRLVLDKLPDVSVMGEDDNATATAAAAAVVVFRPDSDLVTSEANCVQDECLTRLNEIEPKMHSLVGLLLVREETCKKRMLKLKSKFRFRLAQVQAKQARWSRANLEILYKAIDRLGPIRVELETHRNLPIDVDSSIVEGTLRIIKEANKMVLFALQLETALQLDQVRWDTKPGHDYTPVSNPHARSDEDDNGSAKNDDDDDDDAYDADDIVNIDEWLDEVVPEVIEID